MLTLIWNFVSSRVPWKSEEIIDPIADSRPDPRPDSRPVSSEIASEESDAKFYTLLLLIPAGMLLYSIATDGEVTKKPSQNIKNSTKSNKKSTKNKKKK